MSNSNTANSLAVRVVGRNPAWYENNPAALSLGRIQVGKPNAQTFNLLQAPSTHIRGQIRKRQTHRSVLLRFAAPPSTGAAYTVDVQGTSATFDAGAAVAASVSDIYEGLFEALGYGAGGTPPTNTVAELIQDGTNEASQPVYTGILIEGVSDGVTFAEVNVTASTATLGEDPIGVYIEPDAVAFEVWATSSRGTNAAPPADDQWWRVWPAEGFVVLDEAGVIAKIDSAGYDLATVVFPQGSEPGADELSMPSGNLAAALPLVWVYIGPAMNEDTP